MLRKTGMETKILLRICSIAKPRFAQNLLNFARLDREFPGFPIEKILFLVTKIRNFTQLYFKLEQKF